MVRFALDKPETSFALDVDVDGPKFGAFGSWPTINKTIYGVSPCKFAWWGGFFPCTADPRSAVRPDLVRPNGRTARRRPDVRISPKILDFGPGAHFLDLGPWVV